MVSANYFCEFSVNSGGHKEMAGKDRSMEKYFTGSKTIWYAFYTG